MDARPALTPRQAEIVSFISQRIAANGYPPTIREIGAHMGIRSTNGVADHLKALKRKGYLSQAASKSRTWRIIDGDAGGQRSAKRAVSQLPAASGTRAGPRGVRVPLLGRVAAGEPILAWEDAQSHVEVDPQLVPAQGRVFALKVQGESMIEAGILPDDIIFVRQQPTAESGAVVVVMLGDEATVKRYVPRGSTIRFEPANAAMRPLVLRGEAAGRARIIGVVVGLSRRF